ncbi:hypothetical protein G3N95_32545 [Paraburkholderia sp. Tr-20389]|uniref:hypothetical protein n=1 Tax=Paraburkholderia sp. Tr-20389 TaxID=2703903 RepID=UPI0019809A44|nr:hypothetical protein [Paraburkholderia sp. Tr-20389]MBN3757692.1 hypothetical protein [Paraburkholderia sp. Tr-20389]
MKIDAHSNPSWHHHSEQKKSDDSNADVNGKSPQNDHAQDAGAASPDSRSDPRYEKARQQATEQVLAIDTAEKADQLSIVLDRVLDDMQNGKDATDDVIAFLLALDQVMRLYTNEPLSTEKQNKIDRLTRAIANAPPGESPESIRARAQIDPPKISHQSDADRYAKYGKSASTFTRALIFDWARFNNSNVLKGTLLGKLQQPRLAMLDNTGPYTRSGVLLGTRLNAGASYLAKGISALLSGLQKASKGEDPTKDFLAAFASFGQGANELVIGVGTDAGNHLARSRTLQQQRAASQAVRNPTTSTASNSPAENSTTPPASTSQAVRNPTTPEASASPAVDQDMPTASTSPKAAKPTTPVASNSPDFANFAPDDPLAAKVDQDGDAATHTIDDKVSEGQEGIRQQVIAKLNATPQDDQQLVLQDSVHEIAPDYYQMNEIGDGLKKRALEIAKDTHENIVKIDEQAQPLVLKLKLRGISTLEEARRSGDQEVIAIVKQLDHYADLKRSAYDVFNKAMDQSADLLKQSTEALRDLKSLRGLPREEAESRLKAWADKYGKNFSRVQDTWLKQTDSWPEWMKISKPLRMQLIPTGVNTAFGGITFGIALDDYLKKQKNGELTEQDRLAFASACMALIAGPIGFIPVVGPIASMVLTIIGVICGGMADQFEKWKAEEAEGKLREQIRQTYNKANPDHGIGEPYDGG